jgi:hypothetical protein
MRKRVACDFREKNSKKTLTVGALIADCEVTY